MTRLWHLIVICQIIQPISLSLFFLTFLSISHIFLLLHLKFVDSLHLFRFCFHRVSITLFFFIYIYIIENKSQTKTTNLGIFKWTIAFEFSYMAKHDKSNITLLKIIFTNFRINQINRFLIHIILWLGKVDGKDHINLNRSYSLWCHQKFQKSYIYRRKFNLYI